MTASDWVKMTIGDIAQVKGGKRLPAGYAVQDEPTPHPYIRVTDLRDGGIDESNLKYVPEGAASAIRAYRIRASDVFISVAGTLGIVGRIPPRLDGANLTENADRLTGIKCDVDYLAQYLRSTPIQNEIKSISTIGAQPKLALGRIKTFEILVPKDRAEQGRIAEALGDVDDLIESLSRLLVKKQAIRQGMMQELLAGRVRLPGFAEEWREQPFEEIAIPAKERVDPKKTDPQTRLVELEHIGSGSGCLVGGTTAANAVSLKAVFRPGDVLFGKLRSYLRKYWLADSVGLCSTEIWVLRARGAHRGAFVRYVVESDRFIVAASGSYGTHMPRADWNVVRKLAVPVPPPDEQDAIAEVLSEGDKEIEALKSQVVKVRDIKAGMMQELFSGRTRLPVEVVP